RDRAVEQETGLARVVGGVLRSEQYLLEVFEKGNQGLLRLLVLQLSEIGDGLLDQRGGKLQHRVAHRDIDILFGRGGRAAGDLAEQVEKIAAEVPLLVSDGLAESRLQPVERGFARRSAVDLQQQEKQPPPLAL